MLRRPPALRCVVTCAALLLSAHVSAAAPNFTLTVDPALGTKPFTGRVYVFLARPGDEPRQGPDWFQPEPFLSKDVKNWPPGQPLRLAADDPSIHAFPTSLREWNTAGYAAQAVVRFNPLDPDVGTGIGNGFGPAVPLEGNAQDVPLTINRLIEDRRYEETQWGKLIEVRSKLLSDFHRRDVSLRGTVILPSSYYDQPQRKYPVIFTIPGFGGDHRIDPVREPIPEQNESGVEFLRVMLDPKCPLGHHVFADSANNGPVGTAFVTEFLPAFEKSFRAIPAPTARFLTGHSSGGWSSLWLQVSKPDHFGGTWSTAPDPVDFRDFQQINLYAPGENMYVDREGKDRPLARLDGRPVVQYRTFDRMETVLGPGGQLHSFEAVFSPRGDDGRPAPLWNRDTGEIDPQIAEAWKRYDIRLVLERDWPILRPKLAGKLHVVMGEEDTFYLEGATRLLKESLSNLRSDATVELIPHRTHFDLLTPDLTQRLRREMTTSFLKYHPNSR